MPVLLPVFQAQIPTGMKLEILYDRSLSIRNTIDGNGTWIKYFAEFIYTTKLQYIQQGCHIYIPRIQRLGFSIC